MDRDKDASVSIDAALIAEGSAQLQNEIKVLEAWLEELSAANAADQASQAARESYADMLTSRREMLDSLAQLAHLSNRHA